MKDNSKIKHLLGEAWTKRREKKYNEARNLCEDDSEHNYREAIDIYRGNASTAKGDLAKALRGFGILLEKQGKIEEAIAVWKETRALYLACNLREGVEEADLKLDSLR